MQIAAAYGYAAGAGVPPLAQQSGGRGANAGVESWSVSARGASGSTQGACPWAGPGPLSFAVVQRWKEEAWHVWWASPRAALEQFPGAAAAAVGC